MCALRFRGHRYREEHSFDQHVWLGMYERSGAMDAEPLELW
jgi:hypothetical protein